MNTSNESSIRKIDVDMLKFFFDAKRFTLEELEEHATGMFTTQCKLTELRDNLLKFVLSYKNKNSIFYIFLNSEREENLKIVVSSTDEPNHLTQRFAIILNEYLTEMDIKQLSLSSKLLTLVSNA
jgi:hypothetical protein